MHQYDAGAILDRGDLMPLERVLSLFQARNWADLYPLLTDDTRQDYTSQQFAQATAGQQAQAPQVVEAAPSGNGALATTSLGLTY